MPSFGLTRHPPHAVLRIAFLDDQLLAKIFDRARALGFAGMAAIAATEIAPEYHEFHEAFLRRNLPDDLAYLRRRERYDLHSLLPDAKSLILFTYPYRFRAVERKLRQSPFKIARYAWQKDYHQTLKSKLRRIMGEFSLTGRPVTDSAPLAERYWARRAGLGKIGRNGMLIDEKQGSYFLIASLVLSDELAAAKTENSMPLQADLLSLCGSCRRCVEACPTGALYGDSLMDTSRCISFQTIESRDDLHFLPATAKAHRWIFGCDICQQVCPWNKSVFGDERFNDEHPVAIGIAAGEIPEVRSRLKGSVFYRRGAKKLRENMRLLKNRAEGRGRG